MKKIFLYLLIISIIAAFTLTGCNKTEVIGEAVEGAEEVTVDESVEESEPDIVLKIVELAKSQIGKLTGDGPFASLIWSDSEYTYCDRFVSAVIEVAYGNSLSGYYHSGYETAYDDYIVHESLIKFGEPPKGAVVYYGKHKENWNCGHVGISDGEGNVISVVDKEQGVAILPIDSFKAPILGWINSEDYRSQGGIKIILKPTERGGVKVTTQSLDKAILIIMNRLDRLGISNSRVTIDSSKNIIVLLRNIYDPDRVIDVITSTGQLEFRLVNGTFVSRIDNSWSIVGIDFENGELLIDPEAEETILIEDINEFFNGESVASAGRLVTNPENNELVLLSPQSQTESEGITEENSTDESEFNPEEIIGTVEYNNNTNEMFLVKEDEEIGEILIDSRTGAATLVGPALITGDELANAVAGYDNYGNIRVGLSFKEEADDDFAEITTNHIGENLAIVLDEEIESAPYIKVPITEGEAEITGISSIEEAKNIELVLQTGAFPVNLEIQEITTVEH